MEHVREHRFRSEREFHLLARSTHLRCDMNLCSRLDIRKLLIDRAGWGLSVYRDDLFALAQPSGLRLIAMELLGHPRCGEAASSVEARIGNYAILLAKLETGSS